MNLRKNWLKKVNLKRQKITDKNEFLKKNSNKVGRKKSGIFLQSEKKVDIFFYILEMLEEKNWKKWR